jgi:protein-disulfide isomerase
MNKYNFAITLICFSFSLYTPCIAATETALSLTSPDTVVLEIDGVKFTLAEIERRRPTAMAKPFNSLYEGEKRALAKFADEYLLEQQAEKEHLTVKELLEKHVNNTIAPDPSEEALRLYYENVDTKQPYEAVRGQIIDRIRQTRIDKAKTAYTLALHNQAKVEILLKQPRAGVSVADAAIAGSANAPVMIIEYADFECPYCQQAYPTIEKVLAEYKDKVAVAYKDTPLPMHSHAEKAAEAAHCAGAQGKYVEFHDQIYATKQLDIAHLKEDARELKLDTEAFDKCLDSGAQADAVKAQLTEGSGLGLEGTPSFYVNGRFVSGNLNFDDWRKLIDEELAAGSAKNTETAQRH